MCKMNLLLMETYISSYPALFASIVKFQNKKYLKVTVLSICRIGSISIGEYLGTGIGICGNLGIGAALIIRSQYGRLHCRTSQITINSTGEYQYFRDLTNSRKQQQKLL